MFVYKYYDFEAKMFSKMQRCGEIQLRFIDNVETNVQFNRIRPRLSMLFF